MSPPRLTLAVAALLLVTGNASASRVGDREIQIPQPPGYEELCASSPKAYEFIAKGTPPDSLLITCFINQQEWVRGEGTILFKAEIMRLYINKTFANSEFADFVANSAKAFGYVNDRTRATGGAMEKNEKKAVDDMIAAKGGGPAQLSAKKGVWHHVQSGKNFDISETTSSIKVQSNGRLVERDVASVMALVNVEGKLLTLKVVNSRNEPHPEESAVSSMQSWVGQILKENAL